MEWRLLRRSGVQARQSELGRAGRWRNLRKAFRLAAERREMPAMRGRVWVVDDIRTTGATLHFACRALVPVAPRVCAFTLARVAEKE